MWGVEVRRGGGVQGRDYQDFLNNVKLGYPISREKPVEACRGGFSHLISSLTNNISAKPALTQNGGRFLKNDRQNILINQSKSLTVSGALRFTLLTLQIYLKCCQAKF